MLPQSRIGKYPRIDSYTPACCSTCFLPPFSTIEGSALKSLHHARGHDGIAPGRLLRRPLFIVNRALSRFGAGSPVRVVLVTNLDLPRLAGFSTRSSGRRADGGANQIFEVCTVLPGSGVNLRHIMPHTAKDPSLGSSYPRNPLNTGCSTADRQHLQRTPSSLPPP